MISQDKDFDPWAYEALKQSPVEGDTPLLSIDTIEGVEPLGDQFGVHPPKDIPDVLYEPLFGQPQPTEAEIAAVGGNPENVPQMQTYAILDAAKVFGLFETLEASGLEHRCLFKGDAYDELKDVAPWIVRLEEGNRFTRNLFTEGEAPWYLWDKEPGIYVRSRKPLDDMWRHFRKFTRVQDENGKWFYFRFWESRALSDIFRAYFNDGLVNIFGKLHSIIVCKKTVEVLSVNDPIKMRSFVLRDRGKKHYLKLRETRLAAQITDHFLQLPEFADQNYSDIQKYVSHYVAYGRSLGLTDGADIFTVALGFCLSKNPEILHAKVTEILRLYPSETVARRMKVIDVIKHQIKISS